ncbi:MAG: response regulator transcription factor [Anaerolineae bacterium]|nr:response regulator transcription factor [Anaerolineae bacterium]
MKENFPNSTNIAEIASIHKKSFFAYRGGQVDSEVTLLLVEDDFQLRMALRLYLGTQGFHVLCAADGLAGLRLFYEEHPQIVLLDIMIPKMNGWDLCQRIREVSEVPIIIVSACGREEEKVRGLKLGADDYIVKPFSMRELVARIDAVLRRSHSETVRTGHWPAFTDEELFIDGNRWEVRRNGKPLSLTALEMRFLLYLVKNANRVLTHQQILEHVWGREYTDALGYTKQFVWRLRRKIEQDPEHPKYIVTEKGIGYRFCCPS